MTTKDELQSLDYAYLGEPFANIGSGQEDASYLGEPFYYYGPSVTDIVIFKKRWKSAKSTNSPIGYYSLGQAYPRTRLRQPYPVRQRRYTILKDIEYNPPAAPSNDITIDLSTYLEYLIKVSQDSTITLENVIKISNDYNSYVEYLQNLALSNFINLEYLQSLRASQVINLEHQGAAIGLASDQELFLEYLSSLSECTGTSSTLGTDLMAYWPFDNSTADEIASYHLSGTAYYNATTKAGGSHSLALSPIGSQSGSMTHSSTDFNGSGDFTISVWFRHDNQTAFYSSALACYADEVDDTPGGGGTFNNTNLAWKLTLEQDGFNSPDHFEFTISSDGTTDTTSISGGAYTNNTLYHVVATKDNTDIKIYVNGVVKAADMTPSIYGSTSDLFINKPAFFADSGTDSFIDEVGFWTRALTGDEVAELYNSGTGKFYPFDGDLSCTSGVRLSNNLEWLQNIINLNVINNEYGTELDSSNSTQLEYLQVIAASQNTTVLEYLQSLSQDEIINLENQASSQLSVLPIINIEYLQDLYQSNQITLENLISLSNNNIISIENLRNIILNTNYNTEYSSTLNFGNSINLEYLQSILQNETLQIESLVSFGNNSLLNIEWLLSINSNQTVTLEYSGAAGVTLSDQNLNIEYLSSIKPENRIYTENLSEVFQNNSINLENLINIALTSILNQENLQTTTTIDPILLEYKAVAQVDSLQDIPLEYLINTSGNNTLNIEYLQGFGVTTSTFLEYLLTTDSRLNLNKESLAEISSAGVLNLENLISFGVSQSVLLESINSLGLDTGKIVLEYLQGLSSDQIIKLEYSGVDIGDLSKILRWIAKERRTLWVATQDGRTTSWTALNRPVNWQANE